VCVCMYRVCAYTNGVYLIKAKCRVVDLRENSESRDWSLFYLFYERHTSLFTLFTRHYLRGNATARKTHTHTQTHTHVYLPCIRSLEVSGQFFFFTFFAVLSPSYRARSRTHATANILTAGPRKTPPAVATAWWKTRIYCVLRPTHIHDCRLFQPFSFENESDLTKHPHVLTR